MQDSVYTDWNCGDDKGQNDSDECYCYLLFFDSCAQSAPQSLQTSSEQIVFFDLFDQFVGENAQEHQRQNNHDEKKRHDFVVQLVVTVLQQFCLLWKVGENSRRVVRCSDIHFKESRDVVSCTENDHHHEFHADVSGCDHGVVLQWSRDGDVPVDGHQHDDPGDGTVHDDCDGKRVSVQVRVVVCIRATSGQRFAKIRHYREEKQAQHQQFVQHSQHKKQERRRVQFPPTENVRRQRIAKCGNDEKTRFKHCQVEV